MSVTKKRGQNIFLGRGLTVLSGLAAIFLLLSCGSDDQRKTDPTFILGQAIETDDEDARNPRLAMDSATGDAMAVWEQWDGRHYNIWANRYSAATGWGDADPIENIGTGNARSPEVVLDSTGSAIVVWAQSDGTRYNIWANRFVPGVGWDENAAELIEVNDSGSAVNPRIVIDSSGNAIVVWQHFDGTRYNIWANRFVSGVGWDKNAAELIEANDTGNAVNPGIAIDSSGNAIVVWQHFDGSRYNIWANVYLVGLGWAGSELIETQDLGRAAFPQIAMDPATGDAIAVWQQFDGDRYNIWANLYVSGVGWSGAQLIEVDDVGNDARPRIAMDPSGDAMAVWQQYDGIRYNVWANRFTSGTGWGLAELIETNNSGDAAETGVTANAVGNAVAVWQLWDGARYNLWARTYTPGFGWGVVERIGGNGTGDAWSPQVVMDNIGNALVVWSQGDGLRFNIWARRL